MAEEEAFPSGADIVGGVGQAVGVASSIYSAYETDQYRTAVLDGIKTIEYGIETIENQLATLSHELKYWELFNKLDNPLMRIKTAYSNWSANTATVDFNDVAKAMMEIHEASCGEVDGYAEPAVYYYLQTLSEVEATSRTEMCYLYFTRLLQGRLLKGLGILGSKKNPNNQGVDVDATDPPTGSFALWQKRLRFGQPGQTQGYLLKPYLQYQGTLAQQVIDGSGTDIDWMGRDSTKINSWSTPKIYYGMNQDVKVPDGHVLVGIHAQENAHGATALFLYHGEVDATGYLKANKPTAIGRGTSVTDGSPSYDSQNNLSAAQFIDANPVEVPEGCVITDLQFALDPGELWVQGVYQRTGGKFPEPVSFNLIHLSAQYAKFDRGGVDMSTAQWTTNGQARQIEQLNPKSGAEDRTSPNLPPHVWPVVPDLQRNGTREWTHAVNMELADPPSEFNSPLTGVQIYNDRHDGHNNLRLVFRTTTHRDSFADKAIDFSQSIRLISPNSSEYLVDSNGQSGTTRARADNGIWTVVPAGDESSPVAYGAEFHLQSKSGHYLQGTATQHPGLDQGVYETKLTSNRDDAHTKWRFININSAIDAAGNIQAQNGFAPLGQKLVLDCIDLHLDGPDKPAFLSNWTTGNGSYAVLMNYLDTHREKDTWHSWFVLLADQ